MSLSRPEPLGVAIASALRADIASGRLVPGQELRQEELAERFGTSRIPVREAMQALERDGLIIVLRNRRSVVAEFDEADLRDHYATRTLLEGEAAALCAAQQPNLTGLQEIQQELQEHGNQDPAAYAELNRQFHGWIWTESGSRWLDRLATSLWQGLSPHTPGVVPGQVDLALAEHQDIIDALASGDPERARSAMAAHISRSCDMLLTYRAETARSASARERT